MTEQQAKEAVHISLLGRSIGSPKECKVVLDIIWNAALQWQVDPIVDAVRLAKDSIHSARLCSINSMSSRNEMLRLMDDAIGYLDSVIEGADKP